MNKRFDSEEEALEYKETHRIYGRVPEKHEGTGKWALVYPLKCHVTVHQPHSPPWPSLEHAGAVKAAA